LSVNCPASFGLFLIAWILVRIYMAPAFYVSGQPARDAAIARQFERDAAKLTAVNPRTGATDTLTQFLADPVELKLLHMVTGDPLRTPTFVMFGNPDYFFQTSVPAGAPNVGVNPGFAWEPWRRLPGH
jgi:hypothetical protein